MTTFQTLIGTVKSFAAVTLPSGWSKFQTLIGTVKSLPVWEEWLEGLEAAGVNTEAARQALATLFQTLIGTVKSRWPRLVGWGERGFKPS